MSAYIQFCVPFTYTFSNIADPFSNKNDLTITCKVSVLSLFYGNLMH